MEIGFKYVISQVITIVIYLILAMSYYSKNRGKILILNFAALSLKIIVYSLLEAWTGLSMTIVSIIMNVIFIVEYRKNKDSINKNDILILITIYVISIIFTIFTYSGFFSLFSVFATMVYIFSVWQKSKSVYKILGIPISILWIVYNIYIKSIFGIMLETLLLICSCVGYILDIRKNNNYKYIEKNWR